VLQQEQASNEQPIYCQSSDAGSVLALRSMHWGSAWLHRWLCTTLITSGVPWAPFKHSATGHHRQELPEDFTDGSVCWHKDE